MKNEKSNKRPNSGNRIQDKRNSKDLIIKNLENKILIQKEQILQLLEYKNICENKLKEIDPSIELPLKNENTEGNLFNLSNTSSYKSNNNNKNKRNKVMKLSKTKSETNLNKKDILQNDKYNNLYQKYMTLLQDYKNLSNNTISTAEYTKMKSQYNEIKNKNTRLLKQINEKEEENEIIKELNQQVETFREKLILSQALINSLRTELEHSKKNSDNKHIEENENIKMTLKKNNLLLSNILKENNELRQKALDNSNINYYYKNNDFQNRELMDNLQNNLKEYENKFDYFNDYINNIKNKINLIFMNLKDIIKKYEKNGNFIKFIKYDVDTLNNIDRFNLDSYDDEKCLQAYINLVKYLLNDLNFKNENINVNNDDDNINKAIIKLNELNEILKRNINGNGLRRLISDALNIIINLSNLYKLGNEQINKENNNINEKISKLELDFEYIKKLIVNYRTKNPDKKLTYTLSYNSQRFSTINRNSNNYYFKYE